MKRIKNLEDKNGPLIALVSVPIGNIEDISLRAKRVLEEADIIYCEDTRNTQELLKQLGVKYKKIESLYSQNEAIKAKEIISKIKNTDYLIAYCSDAGTPGISDPGSLLAKEAIDNDIRVISVPGCSALITGLVISGLDTSDFSFYGFLSTKQEAKEKFLNDHKKNKETMIFYESPLRVLETLESMYKILGNRKFALLREMTKVHEEAIRGELKEWKEISPKSIIGECVICVEGYKSQKDDDKEEIIKLYELYKENNISPSVAAKLISKQLNKKKNDVYSIILELDK